MREIEIKALLNDKKAVMDKLTKLGCVFEPEATQLDTVYAERVGSLEKYFSNKNFLRLRVKNNGKVLFTIKQPQKNWLDKIECEFEVSSKEEMEKALDLMGYQKALVINKKRTITHYNGCEICIDEVENLGSYIEMEKMVEEGDADKIQEELFVFFETLGISRKDRIGVGYDILMLEKKSK